jgi:Fe-S cluster biogenesis protein NfuA
MPFIGEGIESRYALHHCGAAIEAAPQKIREVENRLELQIGACEGCDISVRGLLDD